MLEKNLIKYAGKFMIMTRHPNKTTVPSTSRGLQRIVFIHTMLIEWPAVSVDLIPIEDLWRMLSVGMFAKSKQYPTLKELKPEILSKCEKIDMTNLRNFLSPVPCGIQQVLIHKGNTIPH